MPPRAIFRTGWTFSVGALLGVCLHFGIGAAQVPGAQFVGCWEVGYEFAPSADTIPALAWFTFRPRVNLDTVAGTRRMSVPTGAGPGPFRYLSWTSDLDSLNLSFGTGRTGYAMRLGVSGDSLAGSARYLSDVLDAAVRFYPASARRVDCNSPIRAELLPDSSLNPGVRLIGGDSLRVGYPVDVAAYQGSRLGFVVPDPRLEPPYDGASSVSFELRAGVVHCIQVNFPPGIQYAGVLRRLIAFHGDPNGPNSGPEHSFGLHVWNTYVTSISLGTTSLRNGATIVIISAGPM